MILPNLLTPRPVPDVATKLHRWEGTIFADFRFDPGLSLVV
jgi:hypothetical protein